MTVGPGNDSRSITTMQLSLTATGLNTQTGHRLYTAAIPDLASRCTMLSNALTSPFWRWVFPIGCRQLTTTNQWMFERSQNDAQPLWASPIPTSMMPLLTPPFWNRNFPSFLTMSTTCETKTTSCGMVRDGTFIPPTHNSRWESVHFEDGPRSLYPKVRSPLFIKSRSSIHSRGQAYKGDSD